MAKNRNVPVETFRVPDLLLFTYQIGTYEEAKRIVGGRSPDWWLYGDAQPFCIGRLNNVEIGVGRFWIGASAAVMTLEEVIACGAKTILEIGLAGGLQDHLNPGDIIVPAEAVRDEGTSRHYYEPEIKVESTPRLRNSLVSVLTVNKARHFVGPVWSTDGVYRETREKYRRFKSMGVLSVDMETSAVFALAKYRRVDSGAALIVSDILAETGWRQAWHDTSLTTSRELLLRYALEAL